MTQPSAGTQQKVVGVRFKKAAKMAYFDPAGLDLRAGDMVVAETARGLEVGWVAILPDQVLFSELKELLKPVARKATAEDLARRDELQKKASEAFGICKSKASEMGLPMKMLGAEYTLDESRLTFYFTSDTRVDFRSLLKEINTRFTSRVDLRQVGARDCTKVIGGVGVCGRELCCSSWLIDFNPVSMKMAKEQGLPLNPGNLAGACGRLRCCLRYEYETYRQINQQFPKMGERVTTPQGVGVVVVGHPVKETVSVRFHEQDKDTVVEVPLGQIKRSNMVVERDDRPLRPCGGGGPCAKAPEQGKPE
ncbi:MAG: regulatory iron-sulfur-containing complex subunit RicT [Dehalococcoidia bacterium]|nr:regulatory iron-sulfur-containing complex subunit RicT [Dehalococcoidia bacterium]